MANKHPKGLLILFFTEMWERFGYYLMLGIFTLYMVGDPNATFAGLGMSKASAADIYGTYLAFVYLTPFFGGMLADRFLGYRRSIIIGSVLMAAGYIGLAIPNNVPAFFISLLLICLGNGFFKPNISVLLGRIYDKEEYKHLKDSGFNIFYMGINIGAFVCNFVAAYLRLQYGWGWAFAAAGIGMLVGLVWFLVGDFRDPELKEADKISPPSDSDIPMKEIVLKLFVPALVAATVGWLIPGNMLGADTTDAFVFFCIPLVYFFIRLVKTAPEKEKAPISALLSIFGVVIIFWAVFHQNGSALTYWAQNNTNRELTETTAPFFNAIENVEEVSTLPREKKLEGLHGEDLGVEVGPSYYFDNYEGDLANAPIVERPKDISEDQWNEMQSSDKKGAVLKLWPTELQASINPFFVIILTPVVVGFFNFLANRRKGPSTPGKLAMGMFISAISWLVIMVGAMWASGGKASVGWLCGVYAVISFGELCLSPMGLSLVSKLAPARIAALMMGGWFLSTAVGNKLSGVLSGLWDLFPKKEYFFLTNAILTLVAFTALMFILPWLNRVYKEYTGEN